MCAFERLQYSSGFARWVVAAFFSVSRVLWKLFARRSFTLIESGCEKDTSWNYGSFMVYNKLIVGRLLFLFSIRNF